MLGSALRSCDIASMSVTQVDFLFAVTVAVEPTATVNELRKKTLGQRQCLSVCEVCEVVRLLDFFFFGVDPGSVASPVRSADRTSEHDRSD